MLLIEGRESTAGTEIHRHIDEYFRQLIEVKGEHLICIGKEIWGININLTQLESPFTEEEIKEAI